ncbi:hypothetical protein [Acidimangrovimonas sediminis]|uniref:hypothetical protein n=1 Tax=Acidimangrovimonas sediminis TaxID=2056283 RepID=UPI000C80742C|nr:hypothetical protein [Acidimangrovimonas sediminis]
MARAALLSALAGVALGAVASPAAAKLFTPPPGCHVYLTVQEQGCVVSNLYRCDSDAAGDQWRADFGLNGAFFVSKIDRETRWLESMDLETRNHEVLAPDAPAPASLSKLLAAGRNDFEFSTVNDQGEVRHYKGFDKLTDQDVAIDGVPLKKTEYAITATDDAGNMIWKSTGHEYVSAQWRTFFSGAGMWQNKSGTLPYDNSPARMIQKGQPGFAETIPEYGCDSMTSERDTAPGLVPAALWRNGPMSVPAGAAGTEPRQ